jgi:hypothetical protein
MNLMIVSRQNSGYNYTTMKPVKYITNELFISIDDLSLLK